MVKYNICLCSEPKLHLQLYSFSERISYWMDRLQFTCRFNLIAVIWDHTLHAQFLPQFLPDFFEIQPVPIFSGFLAGNTADHTKRRIRNKMAAKELPSRRKSNHFRSIFTLVMAPFPQMSYLQKSLIFVLKRQCLSVCFFERKTFFSELNIVSFGWEAGEICRSNDFLSVH